MKRYNTPHRSRVIKTRLTEEEYAEFSERVTLCKMSQAEFIRQASLSQAYARSLLFPRSMMSYSLPLGNSQPNTGKSAAT